MEINALPPKGTAIATARDTMSTAADGICLQQPGKKTDRDKEKLIETDKYSHEKTNLSAFM